MQKPRNFTRNYRSQNRVGTEATGYAQWFEQMLAKLGHELWVGDAAEIRAAMVRKQKTDSRDALHMLDLMLQNRFQTAMETLWESKIKCDSQPQDTKPC